MKKLIVLLMICSLCMFAACDSGGSSDTATTTPVTPGTPDTPPAAGINLNPAGNIPDGAFFANTNSDLYDLEYSNIKGADEAFPDTFQTGDVFLYNGYMYIYGFDVDGISITDGWSVIVADDYYETATAPAGFEFLDISTITEVGLICESINGKSIKSMSSTFYDCVSLVSLPAGFTIPSGVTDTSYMFDYCESLASLPEGFTIPDNVTKVKRMFEYCYALAGTITVNTTSAKVTDYSLCFNDAGKETTNGITLSCADATLKTNLIGTKGDGKVE